MNQVRSKITETALSLFNEKGVEVISVNKICQLCDVSAGNFYYYFKNKSELVFDLIQSFSEEFHSSIVINIYKMTIEEWVYHLGYLLDKYKFIYLSLIYVYRSNRKGHKLLKQIDDQIFSMLSNMVDNYSELAIDENQKALLQQCLEKMQFSVLKNEMREEGSVDGIVLSVQCALLDLFKPVSFGKCINTLDNEDFFHQKIFSTEQLKSLYL